MGCHDGETWVDTGVFSKPLRLEDSEYCVFFGIIFDTLTQLSIALFDLFPHKFPPKLENSTHSLIPNLNNCLI